MMTFDWIAFLNQHRIPYILSGANVPKGNVGIKCPFCGPADPSEHMIVSTRGFGWHCWRDKAHKGRRPAYLVANLLKCSLTEALRITGHDEVPLVGLRHAAELINQRLKGSEAAPEKPRTIKLPKEFRRLRDTWAAKPFLQYLLQKRGIRGATTKELDKYDLRYCVKGPFKGRIIFPVYHEGRLISWTGRTIYKGEKVLRYKALTTDKESAENQGLEPALAPISHHLLWYDDLIDCAMDTLVAVEGPFDALVLRHIGYPRIMATCFFTSMPTHEQGLLIKRIAPRFRHRIILLDREAYTKAVRVRKDLRACGFKAIKLPDEYDDPAEIRERYQLFNLVLATNRSCI